LELEFRMAEKKRTINMPGREIEVTEVPNSVSSEAESTQKFAIRLPEIRFDGNVYKLRSPLGVLLSVEDEAWKCEDDGHHIASFGNTRETALNSLCEDFAVLWQEIAQASNEEITPDAQRIKNFLISIVQAVEPE
jgi:hypothetical protein